MAFVTPTDVATGDVLTASRYNQDVVENVTALHDRDGLVFISRLTVTSTTTGSLNDVFTSDFLNYRIALNVVGTGNQNIAIRLRASGSDNSSSNYQYRRHGVVAGASFTDSPATTTSFSSMISSNPLGDGTFFGDILQPQATAKTAISGLSLQTQSTDLFTIHYGGMMTVTTAYDGLTLFSAGNFTGTLDVYGYGK
jgi:hypothetical protein